MAAVSIDLIDFHIFCSKNEGSFDKNPFLFQTSSNVENLSPQIIKQVARELQGLASNPPEGIKIFTNDEDITDIQATIEGPSKYIIVQNVQDYDLLEYQFVFQSVCDAGSNIKSSF